jgi:pimeloyl-ACP methyl ester carboxylesterase
LCKVDHCGENFSMIRDKFVHHNNSSLHYAKAGNGDKHLLVFHGFGQDISVFDFFTQSLARHYTFYVFDLYFHGRSRWGNGEETLEKEQWKETVELFLQHNHIDNFSLAGFSLGGKFVLATAEAFPEKTKEIFLIAPDGIKTSFWYTLATYPLALRRFFRSMILRPQRFLSIARLMNRSGLVDQGLIRFAEYQMNSEEKRARVYYSWVVFRHLTFNLATIAALINDHEIKLTLIVGKYDKVISPGNMNHFLKKLKRYRLEILESGHSGLINQTLPFFMDTMEQ